MSTFSRMCGIEALHVFVDCGSRSSSQAGRKHKRKEEGLVGPVHLTPNRGRYFKEHVTYMSLIWIFTKPYETLLA